MSELKVHDFMGRKVATHYGLSPEELLRTPKTLLSAYQRQEAFLLQVALLRQECPNCTAKPNLLEACTDEVYGVGDVDKGFVCPACRTPLLYVVPAFGPVPWLWQKDKSKTEENEEAP